MDAFYTLLASNLGLLNGSLLGIIFLLARQRYNSLVEDNNSCRERLDKLEKTFLTYGMKIYEGD